jgi:Mg-chelatase subunit ChlD
LHGEEHQLLTFAGEPFTSDPKTFRHEVSTLSTKSGYDVPESSLDALMLAIRQPFAPDASKVIILVTDAPPQIPDKETGNIEEVIQAIRDTGIQQVYLVMNTKDPQSMIYLRLLEATRGVAYELGSGDEFRARAEHFKRTLMALGKTISSAATS